MNTINVLIYVISALFFTALGIFTLLLPTSNDLRGQLVDFLLHENWTLYLMGIIFLVIGLFIFGSVLMALKRRLYLIRGGHFKILLAEKVFKQHLDRYWNHRFPKLALNRQIAFKKNKISISADLPFVPIHEREVFLKGIQEDLEDLFSRVLGFQGVLELNVAFGGK